jgi:unspecific monooxygenase
MTSENYPTIDVDPRSPAFYQNPYQLYSEQADYPLFYWQQYNMWCASSFELVNALFRDKRFGRRLPPELEPTPTQKSHPPHLDAFRLTEKHSLLNLEAPDHTRLRSLINHAFINRQIETLRPDIEAFAMERINSFRDLGKTDLLVTYAMPIPATIIARMLGVPDSRVQDLLDWSHAMVKVYTLTQSVEEEIEANQAAVEFTGFLQTLINERREKPETDLLSHLIEAEIDGESLTDDELISTAILLLNAGHEATVHQAGNAIKSILESGLEPESLFENPKQTRATIAETMRFDAPLHLFTRYALVDVSIEGVTLKAGQEIALLLGAANRDPKRFTEANRFDPFRKDGGHISLGAGIHYCVGAILARLELEISIPLIFQELSDLKLATVPSYKDAFHFHGLEKLEVTWR